MSNIFGLSSLGNRRADDDNSDENEDDPENTRYVGGVDMRGGGSGLAVLPTDDRTPSSTEGNRRIITMYRNGFTVDNGPYRRLNDPANAEFLQALAKGATPREFGQRNVEVGLVDRRTQDYEEEGASPQEFRSFQGAGEAIGSASTAPQSGIIDPGVSEGGPCPEDDLTSIQIRFLTGKKQVIKISKKATVQNLAYRINQTGMAGSEPYTLVTGYPPRSITDLSETVEEAGLANASVSQKKA